MRLTDQALVAVTAARQAGRERRRHPTAADVLVGLAVEPDGRAGALLRAPANAASRLLDRTASARPDLPAVEAVVARTAPGSARAVTTGDLLAALLEIGGPDVTDLLASCGYDPPGLYRAATQPSDPGAETFGLGSDPDLSAEAAVAVARVRATAGGAVALVVAVAASPEGHALVAADDVELTALLEHLRRRGEEGAGGHDWDRGLDAVLEAARAWRQPPVQSRDLLRAAVTSGGVGPGRLLDEVERRRGRGDR